MGAHFLKRLAFVVFFCFLFLFVFCFFLLVPSFLCTTITLTHDLCLGTSMSLCVNSSSCQAELIQDQKYSNIYFTFQLAKHGGSLTVHLIVADRLGHIYRRQLWIETVWQSVEHHVNHAFVMNFYLEQLSYSACMYVIVAATQSLVVSLATIKGHLMPTDTLCREKLGYHVHPSAVYFLVPFHL